MSLNCEKKEHCEKYRQTFSPGVKPITGECQTHQQKNKAHGDRDEVHTATYNSLNDILQVTTVTLHQKKIKIKNST